MVKSELVEVIAARCGITRTESERYLNAFIALIYEQLKTGNKVQISGFGQFSVSHREARLEVHPRRPSERITIPELNTPKFVAGQAFKEAVKLKK